MLLGKFFMSCFSLISRRFLLLVALNWLFFGAVVVAALLGQFLYRPLPYTGEPVGVDGFFLRFDWPLMVLSIFLFNLVLSGFVFVTLPGLVFFPLSVVVLVVRAVLWGFVLNQVPTPVFLAVFPTLILESEGYVLAALGGVNLGLSWLVPKWTFGEEEGDLSRVESFKKALKETARIYVFVVIFLFVAAVVETATLILL